MKDKPTNPFASKEYRFLCWLAEHQSTVAGKKVVRFSQKELAVECESCETTINRWLATLRDAGCVESAKKGNYCVTPRGHAVIAKMKAVEKVLGGKENAG
ncbi:MAG: helix-turn-helix domain-containing protein [Clostridia bacterium]|nr:helix-turn-helix domain-containing protein [Clostridia bacterium]